MHSDNGEVDPKKNIKDRLSQDTAQREVEKQKRLNTEPEGVPEALDRTV